MGFPRNYEPQPGVYFTVPGTYNPATGAYTPGTSGGSGGGSSSSGTVQRAPVAVPSTAGGIQVVAASSTARIVSIPNNGTATIGLHIGTAAGTFASSFVKVLPLGLWESPLPTTAAISAISETGTNNTTPVEYL